MALELTVNGVTRRAYATLKDDYLVDNMVIASETGSLGAGTSSPESRANIAPVVTLQGDMVNGEHVRSVRVGEPLSFTTHMTDDGVPVAWFCRCQKNRGLVRVFLVWVFGCVISANSLS